MNLILAFIWFLFILSSIIFKFNLATLMAFIGTVMFTMRKFRYISKFRHHVVIECLGLFFTVMFQLLFNRFYLIKFILYTISRVCFMLVIWYDCKFYVYTTEEVSYERKD